MPFGILSCSRAFKHVRIAPGSPKIAAPEPRCVSVARLFQAAVQGERIACALFTLAGTPACLAEALGDLQCNLCYNSRVLASLPLHSRAAACHRRPGSH